MLRTSPEHSAYIMKARELDAETAPGSDPTDDKVGGHPGSNHAARYSLEK